MAKKRTPADEARLIIQRSRLWETVSDDTLFIAGTIQDALVGVQDSQNRLADKIDRVVLDDHFAIVVDTAARGISSSLDRLSLEVSKLRDELFPENRKNPAYIKCNHGRKKCSDPWIHDKYVFDKSQSAWVAFCMVKPEESDD